MYGERTVHYDILCACGATFKLEVVWRPTESQPNMDRTLYEVVMFTPLECPKCNEPVVIHLTGVSNDKCECVNCCNRRNAASKC